MGNNEGTQISWKHLLVEVSGFSLAPTQELTSNRDLTQMKSLSNQRPLRHIILPGTVKPLKMGPHASLLRPLYQWPNHYLPIGHFFPTRSLEAGFYVCAHDIVGYDLGMSSHLPVDKHPFIEKQSQDIGTTMSYNFAIDTGSSFPTRKKLESLQQVPRVCGLYCTCTG